MARLIQRNSTPPQNSGVTIPQATQSVSNAVPKVIAPAVKTARRRPRWFFPFLFAAVAVTVGEVCFRGVQQAYTRALNNGEITQVQHELTLPSEDSASFAVSSRGDKYLLSYKQGASSLLQAHRTSGGILWGLEKKAVSPAFSQDGSLVFNGTEVLNAETGQLRYQIPAGKHAINPVWASLGNRAVWSAGNHLQVWDKASGKVTALLVPGVTESASSNVDLNRGIRVSPDGKWLATFVGNSLPEKSKVLLWDLDTPTNPRTFSVWQMEGAAFGLAFSPDSQKLLYSGSKQEKGQEREHNWLVAWSLKNGEKTLDISPENYAIQASWSPDGKYAVVRGVLESEIYDALTGKRLWHAPFRERDSSLDTLYLTANNRLYYFGYEGGQSHFEETDIHLPDSDNNNNKWSLEYWDLTKVLR